jgi:hypothetical protein
MSSSESGGTASSTSAFVSSLIFYGIIGSIILVVFIVLRPKERRVYEPKTLELAKSDKEQIPPRVPKGPFAWASFTWSKPQSFFLQYGGIDAYLFARYIGVFAAISLIGCFMIMPILLPVNATNGQNLSGFDLLSFANVTNKNRFYAHVFLSWFFFGLVIFVIYKELVYCVSLRHAIQTTPLYDGLLSSRTLMLADIPESFIDEDYLRSFFPYAQRVWYARDYKELSKMVKERTNLGNKFEGVLNKVIQKALKYKKKLVKKGKSLPAEPKDYIQKEPTHRLGKIPLIGEKVNSIDYCVEHISGLNTEIKEIQETPETATKLPAVFIEFPNQLEAQRAFQAIPFSDLKKRDISIAPDDVCWDNLSQKTNERRLRTIGANTFLTLMIIFWAIPVAVVGCISNITFLTEKVPFLRFINNCPDVLLGLITGILPTLALAILMSFVPVIIKYAGKLSGMVTHQQVELFCQSWYFGFQVIQVFLVFTLASSASSTVTAIINDPSSAMTLLAQNLPKASNFYISYYLLQGLMTPALTLLQAAPLILSKVLVFLQNTPRKRWEKYNTLSSLSWGVAYPPIELLVVLFLVYSIISPIILIFSTFALGYLYLAYLYLVVYVFGQAEMDLRGRSYPKALFQTFVGLYLAEICLLGLFIMAKSWGPVALEGIILAVTVLAHLYLRHKFEPLFEAVPVSAIKETRTENVSLYPNKDQGWTEIKETGKSFVSGNSNTGDSADAADATNNATAVPDSASSRNDTVVGGTQEGSRIMTRAETQEKINHADLDTLEKQLKTTPMQVLRRFLNPRDGYNFSLIRSQLPAIFNLTTNYSSEYLDGAYNNPAVTDEEPHIWVPKDPIGVSEYEIAKVQGKVDVRDSNTTFDEKDKFDVTGPPPSYEEAVKA